MGGKVGRACLESNSRAGELGFYDPWAKAQNAQKFAIERSTAARSYLIYFPSQSSWDQATSESAHWSEPALEAAVQLAGEYHSSGVVFLHQGRIVAEHYWPLDEATVAAAGPLAPSLIYGQTETGYPLEDVASAQKSVVAVLYLVARDRGLLAFDQPVSDFLGHGWTKATPEQEQRITLHHLLSMTSGLTDHLTFEAEPGTRWHYNTPAYQKLLPLLMGITKLSADDLIRSWLGEPIGWQDTHWVERPFKDVSGHPMMGIVTTPRDLARFGLLILNMGHWNGHPVISSSSVAELMRPASRSILPTDCSGGSMIPTATWSRPTPKAFPAGACLPLPRTW
jgi:hypothetical protein